MYNKLLLLGLGVALFSCRSQYAPIYDSQPFRVQGLERKVLPKMDFMSKRAFSPVAVEKPSESRKVERAHVVFRQVHIEDKHVKIPKFKKTESVEAKKVSEEKVSPKQDPRLKAKRKRQNRRIWRKAGANLTAGGLFLGIAIGLAIANLGSLATLFGLAAIVFLYFGLKKFFKKRKRQKNKGSFWDKFKTKG
ncbi:hypothetical protein LAG90_10190 [Marinilongibacter aquaticus]|uniref:hypothetical protein n=1 Tax=Marinilongibacter aquaticus TaxID=2975157 RepID=UPI0021BD9A68|nr:hypothetical protein [Marinilongibacter aquaticus]UBM57190.1 hypothetical protein LAG90_10190 [Marinilongibacter aquaticus]